MTIELGYLTVAVKDVKRATAFYGELFGWKFEQVGDNGAHVANTKLPLGLTRGAPSNLPNAYFRIDDIAATKARLMSLGGKVQEEQKSPSGLMAVCADDQGTIFSLWQPAAGF